MSFLQKKARLRTGKWHHRNSKIISDICDCDTRLPLELPAVPRAGYQPKPGVVCVITMNGMVDGDLYLDDDEVRTTEYTWHDF